MEFIETHTIFTFLSDTPVFFQIDALFVPAILPEEYVGKFEIAESHPIRCARAGMSAMLRKDKVSQYLWMDEGMRKIRENGDYQWLCNMVEDGMSIQRTNRFVDRS